jgi:hypothetical protein
LVGLGLELIPQNVVFLLLLVQQFGDPLVFGKELGILLQDHFHFFLELTHLLALCLQNCVFLFQHDEVGSQQLLYAVGMLIELVADDLSARTGLLKCAPKVSGSLSHLTDLLINYISITLSLFIIYSLSAC